MKKVYILTYIYNGVQHQAEIENVGSCLDSLCLAGTTGEINGVTVTNKK